MKKISLESFILFNQQLASMLELDLPLTESLKRISAEMKDKRLIKTIEELTKEIEKGSSFSQALAKYSDSLPEVYSAMVKAGEESGNLSEVLHQMASYSQDLLILKNKVKANMIYPAILIVGLVLEMLLFSFIIIPRSLILFNEVYSSFGRRLPVLTRIVIGIGNFLGSYQAFILLIIFLIAAFAFRRKIKMWAENKIPFWSDFILSVIISRFYKTLGHLLKNGVGIIEAFTLTEKTVGNRIIETGLAKAREFISKGEKIGSALKKAEIFPLTLTWILSAAEERDDLENWLMATGDYYQQRADGRSQIIVKIIEPVILVVFGLIVGTIVIAYFLPIFNMGSMVD
ncbi:MAG: type II secretion system F family protein [bacterium]